MNFWNRTKVEIDRQNTTFRWLAEQLDIGESTVSTWRKTNVLPRADHAVMIGRLLGVSVEYLVTGENQQGKQLRDTEKEIINHLQYLSDNELELISTMVKTAVKQKKAADLSTQTAG